MGPEIIETNSVHSGDTQKAIAVIERDPHQTKANFVSTHLDYFRYTT